MKIYSFWLFMIFTTCAVFAAEPISLTDVRLLDGPFRTIQRLHQTEFVAKLDPQRLLVPYRRNAKLPIAPDVTSYGGWEDGFIAGHYGGHFLSAASRMYAATGDLSYKGKVDTMVQGLRECQTPDGYLAAFPPEKFDRLESNPDDGMVVYYTIHKILAGLVDAARYCGNRDALTMAESLADYFSRRLEKLTVNQIEAMFRTDRKENPTNEFGGMAEALTDLYLLEREQNRPNAQRFLKLAKMFCRDWFIDPLALGEDRLAGLHGNTHTAAVCGIAKVCFVEKENSRFRVAAENYWKLITTKHSFVNGSNAFTEKLRPAGIEVAGQGNAALSPATSECCNVNNMLKLTNTLFAIDPRAEYGDYYENALWNHILAQIEPIEGRGTYFLSMRPGDFRRHLTLPYCCQGTGIENAARFNDGIYFQDGNTLYINQFLSSELNWQERNVKIRLVTDYPRTGKVSLRFETRFDGALRVRIPGWLTENAKTFINGKRYDSDGVPGTFWTIEKSWSEGDELVLDFPLALRTRTSMDDPRIVSYFYGPVLLAGKLGVSDMPENQNDGGSSIDNSPARPVPILDGKLPRPLPDKELTFTVTGTDANGKAATVELAPFYTVQRQRYALYWKIAPQDGEKP